MNLTTAEYAALRVFLLKVVNNSADSLEAADVEAARKVLYKLAAFGHIGL